MAGGKVFAAVVAVFFVDAVMAVAVILVPVVMVDAFVMEMPEGASFIDRDVGIALHDIDLIVLVFCHFRVI